MDKEFTTDDHSADYAIVRSNVQAADQQHQHSPISDTLDLSKRKLCSLNEELYRNHSCIKNLHLEGNALRSLPESLFLYLPNLVWLDLRYNQITSLPGTIGKQRLLKYLLLEGNPLKALPIELGDVSTLKALNLRHCPLEFPPEDVVCKGLHSILSFLRGSKKLELVFPDPLKPELPPMEKLNFKELSRSSLDLSDEEEQKKFELLKSKMEAREREEMVQNKPQRTRQPTLEEKRKPKANKHAEEKEQLAIIHQKMRNQEILKEWQKQTKIMQDQKAKNKRRNKVQKEEVPVSVPPYATDLHPSQNQNNKDKQKPSGGTQVTLPRASRDLQLEQRIREHVQAMQERRRNSKQSAQEEIEIARKELEMATLLQGEILQRKREQEYRFTAFTGEISSPTPPRGKPQNVFAMTN